MIYLDNAATTKTKPKVYEAMKPYLCEKFGNPSSIFYDVGQESEFAVTDARKTISKCIGAKPSEIYFTSGGSEANNWAIKGAAYANKDKGNHIITSKIEHPSVLNTCKFLETQGFEVTYIDVTKDGFIRLSDLLDALTEKTILVSIMTVNNEVGTYQAIDRIVDCVKTYNKKILVHTDAVQSIGHFLENVNDKYVDMMSISGHKFHAPKGIGALYIREGTKIESLIHGGGQENHLRAGTENVAGIVGMAKALKIFDANLSKNYMKINSLWDKLAEGIESAIPYIKFNGLGEPYILNVSFDFVESESVIMMLNQVGICASGGSACSTGSDNPSHVLMAMGRTPDQASSAVRFSLNDETTEEEIDYVLQELPLIIERLRQMSPAYEEFTKHHIKEIMK